VRWCEGDRSKYTVGVDSPRVVEAWRLREPWRSSSHLARRRSMGVSNAVGHTQASGLMAPSLPGWATISLR
jgi:hypothetical protein